jgi:tetratricopeptide (TPR) repeat protein
MESDDALAHGLGLGHEEAMKFACACVVIAIAMNAYADDTPTPPDDAVMIKIRELYAKGDLLGVRRELAAAYEATHHPALLFALGQVEFNLRNWQAAIDYYEQFIATNPPQEQVSLATQGIGAARIEAQRERDKPPPAPPPEPRRRAWHRSDTVTVAIGGAAVVLGASAFAYGRRLGNDHSGKLADYDDRTDRARIFQWSGGGLVAAGLVVAGVTIVRWRLRPDDGEVAVTANGTGAAVSITW